MSRFNGFLTALRGLSLSWPIPVVFALVACSSPLSAQCTYSVSTPTITASGGNISLTITTQTGCFWSITTNASWLHPPSGTVNGTRTLTIPVDANPYSAERTATVTFQGTTIGTVQYNFKQQGQPCTYHFSPSSREFAGTGGSGSFSLGGPIDCAPSVTRDGSWITIGVVSAGVVNFTVAANLSAAYRTGSIYAGGQTFTVTQAPSCGVNVSAPPATVSTDGYNGSLTLSLTSGCTWNAVSDSTWLTFPGSHSGWSSGAVSYSVGANTGDLRTGIITITTSTASATYTIVQDGSCYAVLISTIPRVPISGGTGSITFRPSKASCGYFRAETAATWMSYGFVPGTTEGIFNYTVGANTTSGPRTADVETWFNQSSTNKRTISITQDGPAPGCSYSVPLRGHTQWIEAIGGSGSISVITSANCPWGAGLTTSSNWIQIVGAANNTGTGAVTFSVGTNRGNLRSGTIYLSGPNIQIDVVQYAAETCPLPFTPDNQTFGLAGGTGMFQVLTDSNCRWVAYTQPNDTWLTITLGRDPVTGNGRVEYSVAQNSGATRTAFISVGSKRFNVRQEGCPTTVAPQSQDLPASGGSGGLNVNVAAGCAWTATADPSWLEITNGASGSGPGSVSFQAGANGTGSSRTGTLSVGGQTATITQASTPTDTSSLWFTPVTPCRVMDTRNGEGKTGAFGPPVLPAGGIRSIPIPLSGCGVPASAQAYALNVTVVPRGPLGYLTLWPTGGPQPFVSTLNSPSGAVTANAAIVPAGDSGAVSIFVTDQSDVIVDINGYFDSAQTTTAQAFFVEQPCRLLDTRNSAGAFGGPSMFAGQERTFLLPSAACGVPVTAKAYALNATVVPPGPLSFLTLWPSGCTRPLASTLNSFAGKVVANAAIVPSGGNGGVDAFVTQTTHLILDINGYFGPWGSAGSLSFHKVSPCRILDTRNPNGPFGGPIMAAGETRSFTVPNSACSVPRSARAYSLNITVVPSEALAYLTIWPSGTAAPFVSTLNSFDGSIAANAAIVPANDTGAISIYVTNRTHVVLDINGYFAP